MWQNMVTKIYNLNLHFVTLSPSVSHYSMPIGHMLTILNINYLLYIHLLYAYSIPNNYFDTLMFIALGVVYCNFG